MTSDHFGQTRIYVAVCALALMAALARARAQSPEPAGSAIVHGYVRDSSRRPLANATVTLVHGSFEQAIAAPTESTHTDSEGRYRFAALRAGPYSLHAEMIGYDGATAGPGNLRPKETRKIDLFLAPAKLSGPQAARAEKPEPGKPEAPAPEFFDEPQFTVAGVTQATNSGGHGSDTVLRTTEALAKATVSLSKESFGSSAATPAATERSLRDAVAHQPEDFEANRKLGKLLVDTGKSAQAVPYLERASRLNPADSEAHRLLGDVEEKLGNPLEAVRQYQRAAELDPSEPHLFDWGTELLTHRALEPATDVFTEGNRLFPKSVRMLIALGVVWYGRGSYDQAAKCLVNASDLAPGNPTPYLFLGKMQRVEGAPSEGSVARLRRFAQMQPDNALANYYYAVSLWKQSTGAVEAERSARVESLLQKAAHLDPKFGAPYLQLGILYSQRADFSRAISAYQKAIEVSPEESSPEFEDTLEVAHYRLAQAYLRTGKKTRAQEELQLHDRLAKKTKDNSELERHKIQQFVISLQNNDSVSQPQN